MFASAQRNAAFGTAWWALRLDAQAISDVWLLAFACSGRSFGDMFPSAGATVSGAVAEHAFSTKNIAFSLFTFRHQPGEPGRPRGRLLVLEHVHCTLQKTASRSVGFQGSRSPKSKPHQCSAFLTPNPHLTGRWRRRRTTGGLGSYRGRAPPYACHSKTTAASNLKLGLRRVEGHPSTVPKRRCRRPRGTRPFRPCAESNFGRPSTAIRLSLVALRNTPVIQKLRRPAT